MIKINDKYYLDTDSRNYILMEEKINKKGKNIGKEYFDNIGYYGKIEHLLNSLIEKEIKENKEILNNIEKLIEFKKEISNIKCNIEKVGR